MKKIMLIALCVSGLAIAEKSVIRVIKVISPADTVIRVVYKEDGRIKTTDQTFSAASNNLTEAQMVTLVKQRAGINE